MVAAMGGGPAGVAFRKSRLSIFIDIDSLARGSLAPAEGETCVCTAKPDMTEDHMISKLFRTAALLAFTGIAPAAALADTATFTTAITSACPSCTARDTTGLVVAATGQQLPTGWTVKTSANGLYVANHIGATFTLPGKSFDLTGFKLFATNAFSSTTAPVTYTLYAFHLGNPIADVVQVTINSRVVRDLPLSDPRLTNIESLVVRYGPEIGYSYFIETRFTPH